MTGTIDVNTAYDDALRAMSGLLLPYQRAAVTCPERFTWNNWSRQTGKSFAMSIRRLLRGLMRRRNQILLSAGQRQSNELMGKLRQHVEALRIVCSYSEEDLFDDEGLKFTKSELVLPLGVRIIALPANPATARGFTGDLLLDEFAIHKNDLEIWGAAYGTITRGRGEIDVCSTPKGVGNKFHTLAENPIFHHTTLTIHDAIAQGLQEDPEELRLGLDEDLLWQQEYLCQFLDTVSNFLTWELIARCEVDGLPLELDTRALKDPGGDVFVGVDVGRVKDLFVIWAFEMVGDVLTSLGTIELHNTRFETLRQTLYGVLDCRRVRRCCIDATGLGMQFAEEAKDHTGKVEPCTFTAGFKDAAAGMMKVRFDDRTIRIAKDRDTRNDLHSVQKVTTPAGNIRLAAPRVGGSHADRFWACALACYAASEHVGPIERVDGGSPRTGALVASDRGRAFG